MYNGMLHLHSLMRWVILILLLVALYNSFANRNRDFLPRHRKTALFLLIAADITLLVGLYQWFVGDWGLKSIQTNGFSQVMKNPLLRFYAIEHTTGMLIAIILIHIGYSFTKKNVPGPAKHKRLLLLFGLALLIILISVPWPFRTVGAGRTWFPGM
jgi:hypothetical protein